MASLPEQLKPVPAGRHQLSREVMEEHQRERVLEAAAPVFADKGYPATTVDDLVSAARIGVGSFYAHFSGKEECLLAVYERLCGVARATATDAARPAETWPEQICLGLRALLDWIALNALDARLLIVEIQTGGPPALALNERTLMEIADFLRRGRDAAGSAERLPDSLEQTAVSGIALLLHHRLTEGAAASVRELFEDLAFLLLEPYLGPRAAERSVAAKAPA